MTKAKIGGWVLCLLLLGCGGQAERSIDDSTVGTPAGSGAGQGSSPGGGTPLATCMSGFDRYQNLDKACNWLADGLCYDTKDQACACICPRNKASVCLSGLGAEDSATLVTCD